MGRNTTVLLIPPTPPWSQHEASGANESDRGMAGKTVSTCFAIDPTGHV